MKIGLVSNGNDTLSLFRILARYDNEYLVYHDQTNFPYGEKSLEIALKCVEEGCKFLQSQGAEMIIVDPVYELALKLQKKSDSLNILPLFQTYLHEYGFKYSLVGKIGVLSDFGSKDGVQELIEAESNDYKPTEIQLGIKKFNYPFHYWVKFASSWVYNIHDLGIHNPYLIRTMKNDLRYFKDANVDTILPMHYHYFSMQRTIKSFFNFHNTRFHDLSVMEECFKNLVQGKKSENYSVSVWTNQNLSFLQRDKILIWSMQRGKTMDLDIHKI